MLPKPQQADCAREKGGVGRANSGIDAIFKNTTDAFCKVTSILIDYVSNVNMTAEFLFFILGKQNETTYLLTYRRASLCP